MALNCAYLLLGIFLFTLAAWLAWMADSKKLNYKIRRGRSIVFHLYHKVAFPMTVSFASMLLVATLLNNLEVHQWQSEYATVLITSNFNLIPS